jgi:hypothetical protein
MILGKQQYSRVVGYILDILLNKVDVKNLNIDVNIYCGMIKK